MCLFSDGVLDQDSAAGEPFGSERLLGSLAARRTALPAHVVTGVVDDLEGWAGSNSFADDVSLVAFDWVGAS